MNNIASARLSEAGVLTAIPIVNKIMQRARITDPISIVGRRPYLSMITIGGKVPNQNAT